MKKVRILMMVLILVMFCVNNSSAGLRELYNVKENIELRTFNSYDFTNPDGLHTLVAFTGDVNYQDPSTKEFHPIDTTLRPKLGGGWYQDHASYRLDIPAFAEEKVIFTDRYKGKDQRIEYKAVARHIPGQLLTNGEWANKQVIYPDAFGEGIDYVLTAENHKFRKEIVIRYNQDSTSALVFDFEITTPSLVAKIQDNATQTITLKELNNLAVQGNKQLIFGTNHGDTYLRPFIAWDSKGKMIYIQASFYTKHKKLYLRKIIPKEFLEQAICPVFTDTVTSYYAGTGHGHVGSGGVRDVWSDARNLSCGNDVAYNVNAWMGAYWDVNYHYGVVRAFTPVDTSGLPDNAAINNVDYKFTTTSPGSAVGPVTFYAVQTSQASTTSLTSCDFAQVGGVSGGSVNISAWSTAYTITLNSTGCGWVSLTGYTKIGLRGEHDFNNSAPSDRRDWNITNGGTYLSITYTVGGPAAPTNCKISQGTTPTALTISWTDNSSDETNFVVEKSTNGGAFGTYATLGAGVTSTTDTLTVGNTYQYRVKATNANGSSAWATSATISIQSGSIKIDMSGTATNYRKPITLTNSGSALTDYQVLVTVDTASLVTAGKMRSDCGDTRFRDSDAATSLGYWIESGINTSSTKIWVKVPSVPNGSKTIYMYYGNSSATSQGNGDNTFIFFDNFEDGTYSDKWEITSGQTGSMAISTSAHGGTYALRLASSGNNSINTINNILPSDQKFVMEAWFIVESAGGDYNFVFWTNQSNRSRGGYNPAGTDNPWYVIRQGVNDVFTNVASGTPDITYNVWCFSRITKIGTSVTFQVNNGITEELLSATVTEINPTKIQIFSYDPIRVDDVRLRKYASPDPTTSVGTEEQVTISDSLKIEGLKFQ